MNNCSQSGVRSQEEREIARVMVIIISDTTFAYDVASEVFHIFSCCLLEFLPCFSISSVGIKKTANPSLREKNQVSSTHIRHFTVALLYISFSETHFIQNTLFEKKQTGRLGKENGISETTSSRKRRSG